MVCNFVEFCPNYVTKISGSSFYGCKSLSKVDIPKSVTVIDSYAFANCSGLTRVNIPETVHTIQGFAFDGCPDLTIYGVKGSTAEKYAREHKISFKEL